MKLIKAIDIAIWTEYKSYREVKFYIEKWHESDDNWWENFHIVVKESGDIDLLSTLHGMGGETLLKIAIDLGVETPDFIPSIPVFRNEIKSSYPTASSTFEKAFKQSEEHPDIAIGLANSALESIVKEILKDDRIKIKLKGTETLYSLVCEILKCFELYPNSDIPKEIKTIGSSLLAASQSIEAMRSAKTNFHGKTGDDYVIKDSLYTYFVINAITTIGLFLKKYFDCRFPATPVEVAGDYDVDDLPF